MKILGCRHFLATVKFLILFNLNDLINLALKIGVPKVNDQLITYISQLVIKIFSFNKFLHTAKHQLKKN
ncbi:hypothetical protein BpHYR1_008952 [Brachionus plicatilis]|uniref:Uncharacterized protein n=1 Tax=Brachionus plicatilis TaxID=10195 RepID=A0A3M7SD84_BRAPC|nr:hypothetical protein BpHYR1_008952 [Brachionus plicatilis]